MPWIVDRDNGLVNMNNNPNWIEHSYPYYKVPCNGDPISAPGSWYCTKEVIKGSLILKKGYCGNKAIITCSKHCEGFLDFVQAWCKEHDPR